MALHILNDPGRAAGLGSAMGQGFGSGFGSAIQAVTQNKLNQMLEAQNQKIQQERLSGAFKNSGIRPELAQLLSIYPAPQQVQLLQSLPEEMIRASAPLEQFSQNPDQLAQQNQASNLMQNLSGQQQQNPMAQLMQQASSSMQQGQQPQGQFGQQQSPLQSSQQPMGQRRLFESPAQRIARDRLNLQRQGQIEKMNKPFLDTAQKNREKSEEMLMQIQMARQLLDTGKIATGIKGYAPGIVQNDETRRYSAIINKIVADMLKGTGPASKFKIQYMESTKPSLTMRTPAQYGVLDQMEKIYKAQGAYSDIADQLIGANGGMQPANLSSLVNKEYKNYIKDLHQSLKSPQQQTSTPQTMPQQAQGVSPKDEESPIGAGVRNIVRGVERGVVEPLAGAAGDIASLGLGAANYLTGGRTPTYEEVQNKAPVSPPTSEQVRKFVGEKTGGYTEPRSSAENTFDNIVSTVGSLIMPGKAVGPLAGAISKLGATAKTASTAAKIALPFSGTMPLKRALGLSAAGVAGSELASELGAGTTGQAVTKLAFMTAAGMKGNKAKLEALRTESGEEAKRLFSNQTVDIYPTLKKIDHEMSVAARGVHPDKRIFMELLDDTRDALEKSAGTDKKIPVNDLIKTEQDLNKYYKRATQEYVSGAKHLPETVRPDLGKLIRTVQEPIAKASEVNPAAGKAYATMKDLHKGLIAFDQAKDAIKESFEHNKIFGLAKDLLLYTPNYGKAVKKLMSSPIAQKLYIKSMKDVLKGNMRAFTMDAARLDKELS